MTEKKLKLIIAIVFLLISLSIVIPIIYTLSAGNVVVESQLFDAKIYNNAQYDLGGNGLSLTKGGVDIKGWEHSNSKFLKVTTSLPETLHKPDSKNYVIGITLPKELYFSVNDFLVPTGCSKVEFKKNDNFIVNTNYTYNINAHSGTVYYTINPGVKIITIQLELKYDFDLWNKLGNNLINQKNEKSIVVNLYDKNSGGMDLLSGKAINNVYSGKEYAMEAGAVPYINDKINNANVEILYKNRKTEIIKNVIYLMSQKQNSMKAYYKELKFKIKLPEYVDKKNNKHYLNINLNSITFNVDVGKKVEYIVDETDIVNGNIVITAKNLYYDTKNENFFSFLYNPPEIDDINDINVLNFARSDIDISILDNAGVEKTIARTQFQRINYWMNSKENIEVLNTYRALSYLNGLERKVAGLGGFYIRNSGTSDSNKKNINIIFDSDNTGYIQVVSMNLPFASSQSLIDIKYKLVDENNKLIYKDEHGNYIADDEKAKNYEFSIKLKTSDKDKGNLKFNRNLLPEKERRFFIKEIKYDIDQIKAGEELYWSGARQANYFKGNFSGYVTYKINSNVEKSVPSKLIINAEGFETKEYIRNTNFTNQSTSQYSINQVFINDKTDNVEVIAGKSLKISGNVYVMDYPYGYVPWIKNIVIGIVLPDGISVNEDSIILKTRKNNMIKPSRIENVDLNNGYRVYKVYAPSEIVIGLADEYFEPVDEGNYLKITAQLDIDNNMEAQTINLNKVFYAASARTDKMDEIINDAAGSYQWAKKTDTYDLNGNGKTDDTIAGVNESNKLAFKIIPQTDFFTIKDFINVNNNDYGPKADINEKEDLLNYKLNFKFNKSANFDDFKYYIPIPKYNSGIDKHLIKNTDKIVQLGLQNNVEVVGDELFNIFYTVDSGMNIDKVDSANWVTAENVTNFNDVTMIKLVTKKTGTLSGNSEINFKLKYSGNDYLKEAGYKVELHSAGKLKYSINGNSTEGIFATNGVKINLNPTMKLSDVVLTAAPDRKPKISGNVNTYTVNESELSSFHNLHDLKIGNIETNNVVLNTKEYMGNNLNMDSNEANKTFGITLSVNGGSEINLLSDNSATIQNAIIGNGKNAKFKYTIYNANNLSDDIMNRSINIVYKSNNGLTLKQKIVINRELKKIGDPATAIISKKAYGLFEQPLHTSKEVNIGENTNFSAQFKVNYIPNLYNQRFFKFSKKLPIGTKITLYEYVGNKNPTYWYYKVKNETDSIDIADFVKMGYTDKKYNKINDNNYIKEVYMLMFDFKEAENNNLNKIQVHLEINSDRVENFISESLSANLHDNSVFTMKNTKEKFNIKDDINLIYNLESASFDIHNYHLAYCITVDENLPKDTYIIVNYKKSGKENVKYYKNSDNQFIIPLGQVENTGKSDILFKFNTDIELNKSSYNMVVDLMNSASEEFDTPLLGKKIIGKNITLENNISDSPSIKILDIDNRVIQKNDLSNNHSVGLNYLKSANSKITLELQKKNGTEYKKINDKLINVNGSSVNNDGVFDISLNNGNNDISIKLSESTNVGTYRLLFVIKDLNDNIIFKIPYSIIISDNLEMD